MNTAQEIRSLPEINASVDTAYGKSFWRRLLAFSGPGALVAVGYMDPGNWVTSIAGGAQYGYLLLSVILLSSLTAMVLQYMCAKLGIVTGMDLAQAMRAHTSKKVAIVLWIIAEIAIMATDVAEVIGSAIALNLLFGIPLLWGVVITVFDVIILLAIMRFGFRKIEAIVIALITTVLLIFCYEVWIANPDPIQIAQGFIPNREILKPGQLTLALGIVGATVMPHNLYLHSAVVQSRSLLHVDSLNEQARKDEKRQAVRIAIWDSNIQISIAFVINCLLLLLGAALFYGKPNDLGTFNAIYDALRTPSIVGTIASATLATLFAVALLASGQNSTITGTLAGQVVMEGFIRIRLPLWARRIVTRVIAVIPVIICTIIYGNQEGAIDILIINSQVFLCIALPFSVFPLVWFTSSTKVMGKEFVNPKWVTVYGWICAIVLTILNLQLIWQIFTGTAS